MRRDLFSLFGCVTCAFDLDEVLQKFFSSRTAWKERERARDVREELSYIHTNSTAVSISFARRV